MRLWPATFNPPPLPSSPSPFPPPPATPVLPRLDGFALLPLPSLPSPRRAAPPPTPCCPSHPAPATFRSSTQQRLYLATPEPGHPPATHPGYLCPIRLYPRYPHSPPSSPLHHLPHPRPLHPRPPYTFTPRHHRSRYTLSPLYFYPRALTPYPCADEDPEVIACIFLRDEFSAWAVTATVAIAIVAGCTTSQPATPSPTYYPPPPDPRDPRRRVFFSSFPSFSPPCPTGLGGWFPVYAPRQVSGGVLRGVGADQFRDGDASRVTAALFLDAQMLRTRECLYQRGWHVKKEGRRGGEEHCADVRPSFRRVSSGRNARRNMDLWTGRNIF